LLINQHWCAILDGILVVLTHHFNTQFGLT
jgi:hypothetical protein